MATQTPAQRTCFVISPIGPDGSEVRLEANDFLELLVEPALEKYGFAVTRADRIAHPTAITTDIVRLVQESDLCLIDLTNNNPNVFYECGRRHETGKPFIQMIKRGHEKNLPFDVSGIRTVIYDVSSTRAARESVLKLQEFIDALVAAGFDSATSGDSLSSIAQGIERIERKVNQLVTTQGSSSSTPSRDDDDEDDSNDDAISLLIKSPREAFLTHARRGHADQAYAQLDRLRKAISFDEYLAAIGILVSMGHQPTFERMDIELQDIIGNPSSIPDAHESITTIAEGAKKYFENIGQAVAGMEYLAGIYGKISAAASIEDRTKAFVANKIGMLGWTVQDHEQSIRYTRLAEQLEPTEPAYSYNLALIYQKRSDDANFHEALKRLAKKPGLAQQHRGILSKHGHTYEA